MGGDAAGTPFGRYRFIALLGHGGMGEVWRAHDTETDRIVAIKVLSAHLSEDAEFQRRFRREAHAAARLNSPHVIPIHNYGEIDGRLYLDMRLIEGRDLGTVLANGALDPARAVAIIGQVAKALHAAHSVGLLHRDIKPSNVLLDDDDFAYLIDFGIARTLDETRMTQTGSAIGTFHYIAPERLALRADEDARADIYSLTCVLYECLTGSPPFPGDTMPQLVAAHLNAPPPRPSLSQPQVPGPVDEVIARGMAKDPNQRYATTVELANAARRAITEPRRQPAVALTQPPTEWVPTPRGTLPPPAHEHFTAQPAPVVTRAGGTRRRNAITLAIAAIVVIAATVGMTVYLLRPGSRTAQNPTAQPNPNASQPVQPSGPGQRTSQSTTPAAPSSDPIIGDWNVTYGAPATATMTLSGGTYTETAKTPVRITTGTCDLPVGTIIGTFTQTRYGLYTGKHGLWAANCAFVSWTPTTLSLGSNGKTMTVNLGNGEVHTFTKVES